MKGVLEKAERRSVVFAVDIAGGLTIVVDASDVEGALRSARRLAESFFSGRAEGAVLHAREARRAETQAFDELRKTWSGDVKLAGVFIETE